jgi:putative membrane protein
VPLAAGALTAWDVFLDPRMAREGFWTWPGGGRYEGIPASNFLGWFATGLGVFSLWALVDPDEDTDARDDGALALYVWTWVGETFANAALWKRPVTALAGSAAMGAFAAPALAARLRSAPAARAPDRGGVQLLLRRISRAPAVAGRRGRRGRVLGRR